MGKTIIPFEGEYAEFNQLVSRMLDTDKTTRADITEVCEILAGIKASNAV